VEGSTRRGRARALRSDTMVGMPVASPFRVCFVCSGNICRSPMGEVVLRRLAEDAGLGHPVEVDSAGTGDWHIGERADPRAVAALAARGYDGSAHRARQFDPRWFAQRDLVVALDRGHERTLRSWASTDVDRVKVRLLRSFEPGRGDAVGRRSDADLDIPDPFYSGQQAFADVLAQVERACEALLEHMRGQLGAAAGR